MEPQKTKLNGRHQEILKQLRKKGFLATEQMARDFAVTMQTIRRDINMLSSRGLLRRYHGGAGAASSVENMAYASRQSLNHGNTGRWYFSPRKMALMTRCTSKSG